MKRVTVNRFDGGQAESIYGRGIGECSISKHFDTTTFPYKLVPYRSMVADVTGQYNIGNVATGSDGLVWGLGTDSGGTNGVMYSKANISANWAQGTNQAAGAGINTVMLIEYHGRWRFWGANGSNKLYHTYLNDGTAAGNQAITFTTPGPGMIHPADDKLYVAYDNKIASYDNSSWVIPALTLPDSTFIITSIAPYGNYIAIGGYRAAGLESWVYLWDRSSTTSVTEVVRWGTGKLQQLQNFDNVLIGISSSYAGTSPAPVERDSAIIRGYQGGSPFLIKEISTARTTGNAPSVTINNRVNFLYRGKMYFSLGVDGGSSGFRFYGLWTLARNRNGSYIINIERSATDDSSETNVLSATTIGDYFITVHTAAGTITRSHTSAEFGATATYETVANPNMPEDDFQGRKQLRSISVHTVPINTSGSVTTPPSIILKYRVDSNLTSNSWITVFTKTASSPDSNLVTYKSTKASAAQFTAGHNYEFQVLSTGGIEVTGISYEYKMLPY